MCRAHLQGWRAAEPLLASPQVGPLFETLVFGEEGAAGLQRDAHHLPESQAGEKLVLYGQSLGGAVLLRALADVEDRKRVRAVVIESSFASYQEAKPSFFAGVTPSFSRYNHQRSVNRILVERDASGNAFEPSPLTLLTTSGR